MSEPGRSNTVLRPFRVNLFSVFLLCPMNDIFYMGPGIPTAPEKNNYMQLQIFAYLPPKLFLRLQALHCVSSLAQEGELDEAAVQPLVLKENSRFLASYWEHLYKHPTLQIKQRIATISQNRFMSLSLMSIQDLIRNECGEAWIFCVFAFSLFKGLAFDVLDISGNNAQISVCVRKYMGQTVH